VKFSAHPNDFGILLPDHDADLERELQGERSGSVQLARTAAIPCYEAHPQR